MLLSFLLWCGTFCLLLAVSPVFQAEAQTVASRIPGVRFSVNGGPIQLEHVFQEGRPDIIRLVDIRIDPLEPEHVVWQAESQRLRAPAEARREIPSQSVTLLISPAVFFLDNEVVILLRSGAALHLPIRASWGRSVTAVVVRPPVERGSDLNGSQFIVFSNPATQKVVFVLEIARDGTLRGSADDLFGWLALPTSTALQGLATNTLEIQYFQHMQRPLTLSVLDPSLSSLGFQRSRQVQTRPTVRTEILVRPPAPPRPLMASAMAQGPGHGSAIVQVAEIIAEYDSDRRLVVAILEDGSVSIVEDGADYTERALIERAPNTESEGQREAVHVRVQGDDVSISRGTRSARTYSLSEAMDEATARVVSSHIARIVNRHPHRDLICSRFFSR